MNPYLNLNRNSNVVSYETTDNSIHIVFKSGTYRNYLYDQMRPGKAIVDRMKSLAKQGYGLNAFISSVVKNNYSKKW